jgi:NitT/TauT family transport system permease protein
VLGIGIAVAAGVTGGLAVGVSPAIARVAGPYLAVLNATPRVALIGLFVIWLGLGLGVRVAMVAVSAFFPVFFNTAEGVQALDPALDRVGRVFGCTRREWFTRILLPHTAPWMLTGVQLAVGRGLVVVVIAEILVGSLGGVGYVIATAGQQFRPADVLAGAALMAVTGCALTLGLGTLGRWLAPWRP